MAGKRRLDAPTTIDSAIHYLSHLQAEGWALDKIEHKVEYRRIRGKGPKLPVASTVTIKLEPLT